MVLQTKNFKPFSRAMSNFMVMREEVRTSLKGGNHNDKESN